MARAAAALTARGAAHVRIGDNGSRLCVNAAITQRVEVLANDAAKAPRLEALLRDAATLPPGERCIVFVATKRRCDQIATQLARARFPVAGAIHGDKDQREREAALSAFRQGDKSILVATDVAARGLDIPGVALVVVFDFPHEVADYVHRVGRTGRAGASGAAVTFLTGNDAPIAKQLAQAGCEIILGTWVRRRSCRLGTHVADVWISAGPPHARHGAAAACPRPPLNLTPCA